MKNRLARPVMLAMAALALGAGPLAAADEIKIGNTIPYSGPLSAFGVVGRSLTSYFQMVNDTGGVNGHKVTLLSRDDAANPAKTVELTRELVERDRVIGIFAVLGAAPNIAIRSYMNGRKVPQLFTSSGATTLSATPDKFPWTMGWTPTSDTEGMIFGRNILKTTPDAKIAVLYQNDDFGKDYLAGLKQALGEKAGMIVATQSYETADPTVDSQVITLANSGATVFVNISTPKFAAQAIKKVGELKWKPVHYLAFAASSIGTVLKPAGLENSEGIITVKFIKDPTDPKWQTDPGFLTWKAFMDKYMPGESQVDSNAVIGFSQAETMHHVLKMAGPNPTRASLMEAAKSIKDLQLTMFLPGITLNTSPTNYAPIRCLKLAQFKRGAWDEQDELLCSEH